MYFPIINRGDIPAGGTGVLQGSIQNIRFDKLLFSIDTNADADHSFKCATDGARTTILTTLRRNGRDYSIINCDFLALLHDTNFKGGQAAGITADAFSEDQMQAIFDCGTINLLPGDELVVTVRFAAVGGGTIEGSPTFNVIALNTNQNVVSPIRKIEQRTIDKTSFNFTRALEVYNRTAAAGNTIEVVEGNNTWSVYDRYARALTNAVGAYEADTEYCVIWTDPDTIGKNIQIKTSASQIITVIGYV